MLDVIPRGPKDQNNSRFRSRLKISIENEIFERATHRGPIFCGEIETSRLKFLSEIKNFDRDQKFQSRSNFFDRWALWVVTPRNVPTYASRQSTGNMTNRPQVTLVPRWPDLSCLFRAIWGSFWVLSLAFRVISVRASFWRNGFFADFFYSSQESPRQTKPKKGPKRKVHECRPFL